MAVPINTALTATLGITAPILAAPLGRGSTPQFLSKVAEAGALGFVALGPMPGTEVQAQIEHYHRATSGRFGMNLTLTTDLRQHLRDALAGGARVVSLWQGDISPYVEIAKASHATVFWTVGNVTDAKRAAELGVDFVVAQGRESGSHLLGSSPIMPLLPAIVDASQGVPVVAAGGIADGRGLAAALAMGASGVWMGTRFVASAEAANHPGYKDHIVSAAAEDMLKRPFSTLAGRTLPTG